MGDTIIFTERLYVDRDGELLVQGMGGSSSSSNILAPPQASYPSHPHDFPATASGVGRGSAPRVSLSMASLGCDGADNGGGGRRGGGRDTATRRRPSTTASIAVRRDVGGGGSGEFVGERTAAAHVLQDSFRSLRRKERGGVLEYNRWGWGAWGRQDVVSKRIPIEGRVRTNSEFCGGCISRVFNPLSRLLPSLVPKPASHR